MLPGEGAGGCCSADLLKGAGSSDTGRPVNTIDAVGLMKWVGGGEEESVGVVTGGVEVLLE